VTPKPSNSDRLDPSRSNHAYWCLVRLRRALTCVIQSHLAGRHCERLVDYGCGEMPYQPLFAEHVREYLGCDLDENERATLKLDARGTLPLPDAAADVVLSTQVLEHVEDPAGYLAECARVLRPGGRLILTTHGVWYYHPHPHDYWRWTSEGLRKIVREAGLDVIDFRGILAPPAYALQLFQDAALPRLPRWLQPWFIFPVQLLVQLADVICPQDYRDREASVFVLVAEPRTGAGGV
jgi:SAM-dependent methyltransferase